MQQSPGTAYFVRTSVASKSNVVLRDEEMVSRADLETNLMYRRAREVGAPLEQMMAVRLHIDARWQSGLSLYREKRRPFSDRERASLQRVTPAIVNAVRNCHLFGRIVSPNGVESRRSIDPFTRARGPSARLSSFRASVRASDPRGVLDRTV